MRGGHQLDLAAVLTEAHLRLTRPRQLVWDVLCQSDLHLTAQQVADKVHQLDSSVNVSSVYRTLAVFDKLGMVRESNFGDEVSRWEKAHADEMIHLVCERCSGVQHHGGSTISRLRRHLAHDHDFTASSIDVTVTGHCSDCASQIT